MNQDLLESLVKIYNSEQDKAVVIKALLSIAVNGFSTEFNSEADKYLIETFEKALIKAREQEQNEN